MNVLIVDDQKDVVSGMKNGIHWERLGISGVFTAFCAGEARQILQSQKIDILLCDIEMPGEDGIGLFRWMKEAYPGIEGIFLTSHAEFDYAREAVKLGSFDYILQPASYEEIESVLRRVQEKIRIDRELKNYSEIGKCWSQNEEEILEDFLKKYLLEGQGDEDRIFRLLRLKSREVKEETVFLPVLIQILKWETRLKDWESGLLKYIVQNVAGELLAEAGIRCMVLHLEYPLFLLLLYSGEETVPDENTAKDRFRTMREFFETYLVQIAVYIGTGVRLNQAREIVDILQKINDGNVTLQSRVYSWEETWERPPAHVYDFSDMERWQELLAGGYEKLVCREILSFLDRAVEAGDLDAGFLLAFYQNFSQLIHAAAESRGMRATQLYADEGEFRLYSECYRNLDEMKRWIEVMTSRFGKAPGEESEVTQIRQAMEYIRENLDKNITRTDVAEHVYLNCEYLSRLFKQKTGMALKDYILNEKVKEAGRLLLTTKFSVGIVASKVGYSNFSHFSQVFRKLEGVTPKEYRQNNTSRDEEGGTKKS